ncbi:XylR family transcriptional regulator [Novipirellula artificiosorum]|uniref:Xylose operon regulatory protein n=1 Tax=Novipirellula artificiosorum TaxID=2528016 RepID=A0A5C6DU00_9BACT|nr:XylR family transcriptional regulator [Novipirellula artificiosorum]TWU39765.1 Xylose operon regulatory protein [Novipirellula artificiosorum]
MADPSNILLLIETSKAFGRKLLQGVSRYMSEGYCDWAVYVEERGKREPLPSWVHRFDGDGVISHSSSPAVVQSLRQLDVPMIETDMCGMGQDVPIVYSDEDALVDAAIEHFLPRGIQSFAWCQIVDRAWCRFRRNALKRRLRERGLGLAASYAPRRKRAIQWLDQRRELGDWLGTLEYPTGILCANDLCGTRLLEAARLARIAVPDQVAVVGVDNDPVLCGMAWPTLSSVEQNAERIGYLAAERLQAMLEGGPWASEPIWVRPTGVETRRSSDVIAIGEPDMVNAIQFIRDQARCGINVNDVVRHVSVSRSYLEKLFREHVGRSPKAEIQRLRLDHAKQLLQGNQSIASVALACGFKSSQYFANVFQREFEMTPGQWRKQHGGST